MAKQSKNKKCTEEFKRDAVRLMRNRGERTVAQVADDLGVTDGMLYRFIRTKKAQFSIRTMCRVLGVSPSCYYDWERAPASNHARRDQELSEAIREIFADKHSRYGAPRITQELAKQDVGVSRKRVSTLMREKGL